MESKDKKINDWKLDYVNWTKQTRANIYYNWFEKKKLLYSLRMFGNQRTDTI